jgi:hypothetical protein
MVDARISNDDCFVESWKERMASNEEQLCRHLTHLFNTGGRYRVSTTRSHMRRVGKCGSLVWILKMNSNSRLITNKWIKKNYTGAQTTLLHRLRRVAIVWAVVWAHITIEFVVVVGERIVVVWCPVPSLSYNTSSTRKQTLVEIKIKTRKTHLKEKKNIGPKRRLKPSFRLSCNFMGGCRQLLWRWRLRLKR